MGDARDKTSCLLYPCEVIDDFVSILVALQISLYSTAE